MKHLRNEIEVRHNVYRASWLDKIGFVQWVNSKNIIMGSQNVSSNDLLLRQQIVIGNCICVDVIEGIDITTESGAGKGGSGANGRIWLMRVEHSRQILLVFAALYSLHSQLLSENLYRNAWSVYGFSSRIPLPMVCDWLLFSKVGIGHLACFCSQILRSTTWIWARTSLVRWEWTI